MINDLIHNPEFWVLVAFLIFVGVMLYMGVPGLIARGLDARADAIRAELDQARELRQEAEALLADYKQKAKEAETTAKSIIEQAEVEAEALAAESRAALKESIERRTKLAEEKIGRAEAQAVSDVRTKALEVALSAAEKILAEKSTGATADALIDEGIKSVAGKLN